MTATEERAADVSAVEEAGTEITDGQEDEARAPRRRRNRVVGLALAAVGIAAGVGVWLWTATTSGESTPADAGPVATAVVERGTIAAVDSWDGTLDFGEPLTVTSAGQGTITRLAGQGETVARGDELYRVDERPVVLLRGDIPMFRDVEPGDAGADANQLDANLEALGYGGFTDDAVREWQADIGAAVTGRVGRGDVVFLPEGGRVDAVHVRVGGAVAPGAPVLDVTGGEQVVSLEADVDDRDRFEVDGEVTVELPDGDEVPGIVSATSVVEVPIGPAEGPEGGAPETETILQVEIALEEEVSGDLVGAPVEVAVEIDERTDVLLVPVNALLALAEGGFGLEIVDDDGTTSIATVTTGLFADGMVEVEGDDIAEGTVVGVAGR